MQNAKHVIVTGASRGIGRALVDVYVDMGHQVWALSRNIESLQNLKGVHAVELDITRFKN